MAGIVWKLDTETLHTPSPLSAGTFLRPPTEEPCPRARSCEHESHDHLGSKVHWYLPHQWSSDHCRGGTNDLWLLWLIGVWPLISHRNQRSLVPPRQWSRDHWWGRYQWPLTPGHVTGVHMTVPGGKGLWWAVPQGGGSVHTLFFYFIYM